MMPLSSEMSQQSRSPSGVCWQCIRMNCDSFVQQQPSVQAEKTKNQPDISA